MKQQEGGIVKASLTLGRQRTALERYLDFTSRDRPVEELLWLVDWREFDLPHCSIYVITPDNKWPCKIGISVAPRRRVTGMQTSVWRPLEVAHCFWCETQQEARRLEKKVHSILTDDAKWLHGEWFDMRPPEAIELIKFAASVEGVECSDVIEQQDVLEWIAELVSYGSSEEFNLHHVEMGARRRGMNTF